MNLGDPDLELIDPTPNIHSLFMHFDDIFFWGRLKSRTTVRWSKKMFSCAGVCSYSRSSGCDVALSEPLLKLRSRKDLVETLLHEMIHAYLFITNNDIDRDGHGPNFKQHMYRINNTAGLNISVYHDFHDEVKLYQTHWWRCDGICAKVRPHFGIVRRSTNRPPGPSEYWWTHHQKWCGGKFVKIKEPENARKKKEIAKPMADITKYITKNVPKNILKPSKAINTINNFKTNPNGVTKSVAGVKKTNTSLPNCKKDTDGKKTSDVTQTLRKIWGSKQISVAANAVNNKDDVRATVRDIWANKNLNNTTRPASNCNKSKSDTLPKDAPPLKKTKIDNYFKKTATALLKDLYGDEITITESNTSNRLIAVPNNELVSCPICKVKVKNENINMHVDECLNADILTEISGSYSEARTNKGCTSSQTVIDETPETPNSDLVLQIDEGFKLKDKMNEINNNVKASGGADVKDNINGDPKITLDSVVKGKVEIKSEPGPSKSTEGTDHKCPCCGKTVIVPLDEHLDECLAFYFDESKAVEGASNDNVETIVIEESDDELDESLILNSTGTKTPCPCCLLMIEMNEMNDHLDTCLT